MGTYERHAESHGKETPSPRITRHNTEPTQNMKTQHGTERNNCITRNDSYYTERLLLGISRARMYMQYTEYVSTHGNGLDKTRHGTERTSPTQNTTQHGNQINICPLAREDTERPISALDATRIGAACWEEIETRNA